MSNPVLNSAFGGNQATAATTSADTALAGHRYPSATDSPVVADQMSVGGVARSTGILLLILLAGAGYGWTRVVPTDPPQFPGYLILVILVGAGLAIAGTVRPEWARFLGPLYALVQGFFLGVISRVYETFMEGIVLQAVLATVVTTIVMMALYVTRTIRVSDKLRSVVIGATLGVAAFYLVSIVMSLFGATMPLVWDSGMFGILFSVFVVALAAFNLLLDFDMIERGIAARAPASYDWFAALGILVTLVWLYLEILRLLSKLRD